jgi:APA family basic amino acid/polyamine antiporter
MSSEPTPSEPTASKTEEAMPRTMGLGALIIYGVGDMLGAGIYGLVGKGAHRLGNMVWLSFVVSMVAAIFTGLSYASLGSRHPRAAGAAYIVGRAFRLRPLAYVVGLVVLASGLTSLAAAARVSAGYVGAFVPGAPPLAVSIGFVVALALVTFMGMRESTWLNVICTTVEVGGLVFIIAVGASYWGSVDYTDARSVANPSGDLSVGFLLSGAVLTFYAFVGFEDMLNVSEEVKDVKRNFPIGLLGALAITTLVYVGISITAISVVPHAELAASSGPLVEVSRKAAPWLPPTVYSAIAIFAVTNTALLNLVMGSRLVWGMARQGLLPKALTTLHPTRKTPHRAIAILTAVVVVLVLIGDISSLARATSVLILAVFTVVNASLIVLQRRKGEAKGALEVPTIVPVFGLCISLALIAGAERAELLIAGALIAGAIATYFVVRPTGDVTGDDDVPEPP